LRKHAAELKKRGVTGLYIFGSTARGEETQASDIDLFFDYRQDGHFSLFDMMDIHEYVEKVLRAKADVVPRNSLHRRIRDKVIAEAVQVF
jgi:hypothetical protein